jgi:hypothetical protein
MKSFALIGLTSFIVFFGLISIGNAQGTSIPAQYPELVKEQIGIEVTPKIPVANQNVVITLTAYSTDLDRAQVTWRVNGKVQQISIGGKSLLLTLGKNGQSSVVSITIDPIDGPPTVRSITIIPEEVDVLWQANSYTPPFYKGKAMYPPEGEVTLVAMPNFATRTGAIVNPDTLIYKWSQDGTVLGSKSGYGKRTLSITGSILSKTSRISVEVSNLTGDLIAKQTIQITPETPKVFLYENSPVYGILFNKAVVNNFTLIGQEVAFEAYPFFYSTKNRSNTNLTYAWRLNDQELLVPNSQFSMVFRNQKNESGTTNIAVNVIHKEKLLQNTRSTISLNYASTIFTKFFNSN